MSDNTQRPDEAAEAVSVTIELPAGLVRAYDTLVESGIYLSRESALLHGLVESWRHNAGSFHTIRLDCRKEQDDRDVEAAPQGAADEEAAEG